MTDFVELNRRFRELDRNAKQEETALDSYTAAILGREFGMGWDEILERRLVVVLGEPGSGKTYEFRQRATVLSAQGRFAFFIRLDHLTAQPIDRVLGVENYQRFQKWHRSSEEGLFFLDSVDEAKFQKLSDFHVALDNFHDALGVGGLYRARILISSRISEWQPQSDAREVLARFPQPPPPRKRPDEGSDDRDGADQAGHLLVVQIEPLDRDRVERFARARGVRNVEAFTDALDRQHSWEFARRPIDVIDLAEYWLVHGRLARAIVCINV